MLNYKLVLCFIGIISIPIFSDLFDCISRWLRYLVIDLNLAWVRRARRLSTIRLLTNFLQNEWEFFVKGFTNERIKVTIRIFIFQNHIFILLSKTKKESQNDKTDKMKV